MISIKHRFHGHNALRGVYANCNTARSSTMSLKYKINSRRKDYRLAVVVSKKVNKSAVKRNRIRRRIYEHFRTQNITNPYDMILTVHDDVLAETKSSELHDQLNKLLLESKVNSN